MTLAQCQSGILTRCQVAAELIETGQYEEARAALVGPGVGLDELPPPENLPDEIAAELLLRCGALTGRLGAVSQNEAQEAAKDLLTKALRLFGSLNDQCKTSEVKYELGSCYWRAGAFDEARVILNEALEGLEDEELRTKILIRRTLPEISEGRYHEAWQILNRAKVEACSDVVKGKWHGQVALVLRRLATAEHRGDYADRAIIEFTAAIYYYEQAGHGRYCATNLNNLAMLLHKMGRYEEAHRNLDRARAFLLKLRDTGLLAQVDETRSRVLLAQQRHHEAEAVINTVVNTLEGGGELALLADALIVQATIQARLKKREFSLAGFRRALTTAKDAGANVSAGLAALSLLEEHHPELSDTEICQMYARADDLLHDTQDAEHVARLRNCARVVVNRMRDDPELSLPDTIMILEARYIEKALLEEKGSVSRAAKRLGLTHQGLAAILKTRHQHLLSKRTPIVRRRTSLFKINKVRENSKGIPA